MLIRLLRSHLRPYSGQIVLIVLAQLVSTMASLYLPSLNGEIIDEGVAKGDTGFILSHGALMLGVSLVQIAAAVAGDLPRRPGRHGDGPRRARPGLRQGRRASRRRRSPASARRRSSPATPTT